MLLLFSSRYIRWIILVINLINVFYPIDHKRKINRVNPVEVCEREINEENFGFFFQQHRLRNGINGMLHNRLREFVRIVGVIIKKWVE